MALRDEHQQPEDEGFEENNQNPVRIFRRQEPTGEQADDGYKVCGVHVAAKRKVGAVEPRAKEATTELREKKSPTCITRRLYACGAFILYKYFC